MSILKLSEKVWWYQGLITKHTRIYLPFFRLLTSKCWSCLRKSVIEIFPPSICSVSKFGKFRQAEISIWTPRISCINRLLSITSNNGWFFSMGVCMHECKHLTAKTWKYALLVLHRQNCTCRVFKMSMLMDPCICVEIIFYSNNCFDEKKTLNYH